jgi:hypothetical protein
MNLWKNPTEQDIEKNLEIVKKGKGELTLPLALLDGEFKRRYREEVGEYEKMDEEEKKDYEEVMMLFTGK